jgi:flagella basal body P-ring formation protein FlgA
VHIRIRAICLQAGAPGQMIHVTDTNHRQIYVAQVVDTSVVKGRLK